MSKINNKFRLCFVTHGQIWQYTAATYTAPKTFSPEYIGHLIIILFQVTMQINDL